MSHATATPDTAGTAGGESPTEREEPGPAAGTPERSTPESQTFITAFDHAPSGDAQRLARRQRAYEAAIAAASAAAAEIKQKLQLREQALKRPGLESVEFVFDPAKPTPLPEGVGLENVLAESCVDHANRVSESWRRDWIADVTGTPEVGDLVKDVFWWCFSAHLRLDPKVVQARHKRRELREQRDALERVQHVALGLGVRPREELGGDASTVTPPRASKRSPGQEAEAKAHSAAADPPLSLRRLLDGFAVADPSTLEPRRRARTASSSVEGEERGEGAGERGRAAGEEREEWITAAQIVAAVSSVTVDSAAEEEEEAQTAIAQESARSRMFERMSSRYVAVLLRAQKGPRRDSFLEHLPDVVAQSAFKSFFLAFPRARVRFGTVFRTQLFDLCQEWFTGIRPSQPPPLNHWDQPGASGGLPPSHPQHPGHAAYEAAKGQRQHVLKLRHESLARDQGPKKDSAGEGPRPKSALLEHARPRPIRTRYVLGHSPLVRSRLAVSGSLGGSMRRHGVSLTLVEDAERPMMASASPSVRRPPLRRRVAERLMQLSGTTMGKAVVNPASVLRATVNADELRAPASSAREAALYMSSSGGTGTFAVDYQVERGTTKGDILFGVPDEDGPEPFEDDDTFHAIRYEPSATAPRGSAGGSSRGSGAGRASTAMSRGGKEGGRSLPPLLSGRAAWVPPLSAIRLSREETGEERDAAPGEGEGEGEGGAPAAGARSELPRPVLPHAYAFSRAVAVAPPFAVASPPVEQPSMAQGPFATGSRGSTAARAAGSGCNVSGARRAVPSPPSRPGTRAASGSRRSGASMPRGPVSPASPSDASTTTTEDEDEERDTDALHPPARRGPLSRVEDISAGTGSLSLLTSPSLHGAPPSVEAMEAANRQELRSRASEEAARRRAAQAATEVNEVVASDAAFRRQRAAHAKPGPRPHTKDGGAERTRTRAAAAEASSARERRATQEREAWQARRRAQLGTVALRARPATHAGTRRPRAPASRPGSRDSGARGTGVLRGGPRSGGRHHMAPTAASERQREITPWHRQRVLTHRLFRLRKLLREGRAGQAEVQEKEAIEAELQGSPDANPVRHGSAQGRRRTRGPSPPGSGHSHSAVRRRQRQQRRFVTRRRGGAEGEAMTPPQAEGTTAEEGGSGGGGGANGLGLASLDHSALKAAGGAFSRLRGAQTEAESKETRGAGEYFTHCVTYRDVVRLSQRRAGGLLDEYFAARRATLRDLGAVEAEADRAKAAREREVADLRSRLSPGEVSEFMLAEQAKREEARRAALRERIAQRTRKRELQQLEGPRATVVGAAPAEPSSGGDDDEEDFDDRYQGFYSAYHRGGAAEGGSSGLAP